MYFGNIYAFLVLANHFHKKSGMMPDPGDARKGSYNRSSVIGHGDVSIMQCLTIMKETRHDDVLSIELEGLEDPIRGIESGHKNLKCFVKEIYG